VEKVKVEMAVNKEKIRAEITETLQKKMEEDNRKFLEMKVKF
jgi:hypothetical protein